MQECLFQIQSLQNNRPLPCRYNHALIRNRCISNSCLESGLWHFLTEHCNWEIPSEHVAYEGDAGCQLFHFIYHSPSLYSCSSSITPKGSMAYSGFEASPGNVDRLCEISRQKPYNYYTTILYIVLWWNVVTHWIIVSPCIRYVTSAHKWFMEEDCCQQLGPGAWWIILSDVPFTKLWH